MPKKVYCGSPSKSKTKPKSGFEKKFSMDFFSHIKPKWQELLVPKYAGKPIAALEMGSGEGLSTTWLLDNVLTHAKARVYCVDQFDVKHPCNPKTKLGATFLHNTKMFRDKVTMLNGTVRQQLTRPDVLETTFDLIYLDSAYMGGDAMRVLEAAVLAWPLLKPGGIFVFDDYTDSKEHDDSCPKPAIVSFMNAYARDLKAIFIGWQVILQKRRKTLPVKPCRSEFYHENLQTL